MTNYENILVSALRYALGRRTYIVDLTVEYIINELPELSEHCIDVMIEDIKRQEPWGYGDECDEAEWMRLLSELEEALDIHEFFDKVDK